MAACRSSESAITAKVSMGIACSVLAYGFYGDGLDQLPYSR